MGVHPDGAYGWLGIGDRIRGKQRHSEKEEERSETYQVFRHVHSSDAARIRTVSQPSPHFSPPDDRSTRNKAVIRVS